MKGFKLQRLYFPARYISQSGANFFAVLGVKKAHGLLLGDHHLARPGGGIEPINQPIAIGLLSPLPGKNKTVLMVAHELELNTRKLRPNGAVITGLFHGADIVINSHLMQLC